MSERIRVCLLEIRALAYQHGKIFLLKIKISSSKTVLKLDFTETMGEQPLVVILDS